MENGTENFLIDPDSHCRFKKNRSIYERSRANNSSRLQNDSRPRTALLRQNTTVETRRVTSLAHVNCCKRRAEGSAGSQVLCIVAWSHPYTEPNQSPLIPRSTTTRLSYNPCGYLHSPTKSSHTFQPNLSGHRHEPNQIQHTQPCQASAHG